MAENTTTTIKDGVSLNMTNTRENLKRLIDEQHQQPGFSLQQAFYTDPDIYRHELERIFYQDWLYVCHTSQLREVGDTQTFDLDRESVIVCRDEQMQIQAFANVCRHRGSRICAAGASKNRRLVCPYHAWSYGLDGKLLAARQMPEDFDKTAYGLKKLQVEVFCGLVFVSLGDTPGSFAEIRERLSDVLAVFDLENTRVVHYECHPIQANWKLVYENYFECYHCSPAHREYAASHSLSLDVQRRAPHQQELAERSAQAGISTEKITNYYSDPTGKLPQYYYHRYGLYEGYLTGSEDGQPVAPLLGNIKSYDGGGGDLQLGSHCWLLMYADHVVLYRFTPRSVGNTDAELFWLVRGDVEDKAIDLERLSWLWNVTTIADKEIIERNQLGVMSRFYQPGPYSLMEDSTAGLVEWYLARIG